MYIKIQTSDKSNGNKGSSKALANYLEKEDILSEKESLENNILPEERKGFFNHTNDKQNKNDVIETIDTNKKRLGRNDAKFYSVMISPSSKEQQHILKSITDKNINSINELSKPQLTNYENNLKEYAKQVMTEYAQNFKREGLGNGNQLVYFGKVEHQRTHKGTYLEVKSGEKKSGELKKGFNTHIHIMVSRKDKDHRFKLSPLASEKGEKKTSKLNGKNVQRGFDRNLFSIKSEKTFDVMFNHKRALNNTIEYKIQAGKETNLTTLEKLTNSKIDKESFQRQIIEKYNKRNGYSEKSKEILINNPTRNELKL
jgi:hypothetical protein